MKYLRPAVIAVLCFFVSSAAAQERRFDVVLTLDGTSSRIDRNDASATAKIVNRSPDHLDTSTLPELNIYFSACQPSNPSCLDSTLYFATLEIPKARIAENRSVDVLVPLSDLQWILGPYRRGSSSYLKTDLSGVPRTSIFLYADVKIPDGFTEGPGGAKRPKYRESVSNVVIVTFE
ncbi:MAG: hypothetical protein IPM63_07900 [Acidobacteriota bacterium]|nr:MAG: hypothetical protein IPM63_07900 [Acidobacteriota bacterium]